jgi:Transposase DDE domain
MTGQERVYQWTAQIHTHLPHLSKPQATVLALWSLGMVVAQSCALTAVSLLLAGWLARPSNTVRQQLREFVYDRDAKRGAKRQQLAVRTCFRPLLAWVLHGYSGTQLAVALDATTLGDRFTVLAVSVLYRGCAIPVAWTVLRAQDPHAWRQEWLVLLRLLGRQVPRAWTVLVLADRGLYARWLYRRIVRLGWHPFLRVNLGGTFRPAGQDAYRPLRSFTPTVGTAWAGRGTAFKGQRRALDCTLLARWEAGYRDPWLILTDLPPETADAAWYGMRAWIEQGFKLTKRAGFQWQRTRITDPARAERVWLAVAVATLWLVRVGGAAEADLPDGTLADLTPAFAVARRQRQATRARQVGVFRRGWVLILVALLNHAPLPLGVLVPEAWPDRPPCARHPVDAVAS